MIPGGRIEKAEQQYLNFCGGRVPSPVVAAQVTAPAHLQEVPHLHKPKREARCGLAHFDKSTHDSSYSNFGLHTVLARHDKGIKSHLQDTKYQTLHSYDYDLVSQKSYFGL